jgi:hypothetical protein
LSVDVACEVGELELELELALELDLLGTFGDRGGFGLGGGSEALVPVVGAPSPKRAVARNGNNAPSLKRCSFRYTCAGVNSRKVLRALMRGLGRVVSGAAVAVPPYAQPADPAAQ